MKDRNPKERLGQYDQPDLFPPEDVVADVRPPETPKLKRRPRKLDEPILHFIGHFDVVTSHQVLYRFFSLRGKSPVYGYRVLKQLRDSGLIISEPIYPEAGAASLTYVRLTRAGWTAIGERPVAESLRPLPRPRLEYKLQYAEMMTTRAPEGWREVKAESAFEVLRKWALSHYRDRLLNDYEIVTRSTIERMENVTLKTPVLVNPDLGRVRLVLPVREGENIRRALRDLPDVNLFPPVDIELVCANHDLVAEAEAALAKYAEREGFKYTLHRSPHFSDRPNPRKA